MLQGIPPTRRSHVIRNVGVAIVILLIALGGTIGYSYTRLSGQITQISYSGLTWAQPSAGVVLQVAADLATGDYLGIALTLVTGVNLVAQLQLTNNGLLPVGVPTESHDLIVNGVDLGTGSTDIGASISPGQTATIPVSQTIETSSLAQLASSIVSSGGNLNVQINGEAHFSVLGLPLAVPFQYTTQISLVQELKQHLESLLSGQGSQQQSNQYNGNPIGSGSVILNGEYSVSPGHYEQFPFTLSSAETITGSFSATATLGNNIIVYVFDQSNFVLYQNGQSASAYYNSGKAASGSFTVHLNPGTYYIVLDNTYSMISTKDVTIQVTVS